MLSKNSARREKFNKLMEHILLKLKNRIFLRFEKYFKNILILMYVDDMNF